MLTALRNNKSLTFYQTTEFRPKFSVDSSYTGGITATAISSTAYTTATVTTQFNNQLNAFLDAFHAERERIANKVAEGLAKDSEYTGARNDAVKLATVYKGNIIKNLIMDCQSYTKYRPNETTGGIFVSWRRKEELPTGA